MKAETIPAPVTSSPKDAPPKRPCLFVVGAYGMVSRWHRLLEPRGFDWPVLRYRSNHENGYDHRPEKPVPNRFYLRLARSERAQDRGPTFNHGFVITMHNLALFCLG